MTACDATPSDCTTGPATDYEVSLITATDDASARMGVNSIHATEEQALALIGTCITAFRSDPGMFRPSESVGLAV